MRKTKGILLSLAVSLALSGCMVVGEELETGEPESQEESPSEAYELLISALEQELSALRAEQESQSDAYEARIRELEALLSEKETGNGGSQSTDSQKFTFEEGENGVTLVTYHGKDRIVEVPQTVNGKPLAYIKEGAFRGTDVEEVILPDGVREIGWFAFSGCYRLRRVTVPASVTVIGYGAFEYCSSTLRFRCPSDSYAAEYARSYGIAVDAS